MDSFEKFAFSNFQIKDFFVNIDSIFGTEEDEQQCVQIIKEYFPSAKIVRSGEANFTAAVKNLWSRTSANHIFHLEDDWILNEKIDANLLRMFDGVTKQLCFICKEKNWDGHALFSQLQTKKKFLGITINRTLSPRFSTSPSIIEGNFSRNCAELMDLNYNPEKQFYKGFNLRLEEYVYPFRSRLINGKINSNIIEDTGRHWREKRDIHKQIFFGNNRGKNAGLENYTLGKDPETKN
ncbi:MAG: hypothetical protein COA52_20455 [Hyphomicrobiales bacterium]|nr:MAG: hypothetical protein COA52_20455 [Hyphomicrobiales bacterium]